MPMTETERWLVHWFNFDPASQSFPKDSKFETDKPFVIGAIFDLHSLARAIDARIKLAVDEDQVRREQAGA
jgi:Trm5-related predicted tRNA methylase